MSIYFTADHHFGHANIIKYCGRQFKSADEMDYRLIQAWNDIVRGDDIVYHLGDLTLDMFSAASILKALRGKIIIVPGNHDRWTKALPPGTFHWDVSSQLYYTGLESLSHVPVQITQPIHELKLSGMGVGDYPLTVVLCHYHMDDWNLKSMGSWHLFGHSHGTLRHLKGKCMDVGVDAHAMRPVSLAQVAEHMRTRPSIPGGMLAKTLNFGVQKEGRDVR